MVNSTLAKQIIGNREKGSGEFGFDKASVSECCKKKYLREGNNVYKNSKWYWEKDYIKMLEDLASQQLN